MTFRPARLRGSIESLNENEQLRAALGSRGPQEEPYTPEQFHERGCPAIADDESDVCLADYGLCVCGAYMAAINELNKLAALRGVGTQEHFCARCHHRWTGDGGAEYCGDCHRKWPFGVAVDPIQGH